MKTKRVVITGVGAVCAFGREWHEIEAAFRAGKNAVRLMEAWDAFPEMETRLGAPLPAYAPPEHWTRKQLRSMGPLAQYCTDAAEQALKQAGLLGDPIIRNGSMGVAAGSSSGSTADVLDIGLLLAHQPNNFNANTYVRMMPHTTAANVAIFFGLTGRLIPTSSACTSGSQGIGYAYEAIKYGKIPMMLAGGAESNLSPLGVGGFAAMKALSTRNDDPQAASRPWDRDRDGFILGEGAGVLVLEELEHAKKRGARIYAELIGFGMSSDAHHITAPDLRGPARGMKNALRDAGVNTDQVQYINAHGTSTPLGDLNETNAIKLAFGDDAKKVVVNSTKSMTGHLLGAAGGIEAVFSALAVHHQVSPPTINLDNPDPECDLDYCANQAREMDIDVALSNSFGFGGTNGTLVLRRFR